LKEGELLLLPNSEFSLLLTLSSLVSPVLGGGLSVRSIFIILGRLGLLRGGFVLPLPPPLFCVLRCDEEGDVEVLPPPPPLLLGRDGEDGDGEGPLPDNLPPPLPQTPLLVADVRPLKLLLLKP